MVRKDGAEVRRQRIAEIGKAVQKSLLNHGEIVLSKTIAVLQYESGLTKEKVLEYLEVLENLGQFEIDRENDKIKKITES